MTQNGHIWPSQDGSQGVPNMTLFDPFWVKSNPQQEVTWEDLKYGQIWSFWVILGPFGHIWPNMAILTHFGVILGHFRPILGHFGGPRPGMAKKGHFRSFWLFGVPGGHGEGPIR